MLNKQRTSSTTASVPNGQEIWQRITGGVPHLASDSSNYIYGKRFKTLPEGLRKQGWGVFKMQGHTP
jgi:hypothetical protein